jgi:hypothetical protein
MEADGDVFGDPIVERGGAPVVEKEYHANGLPEVVELEPRGPDGGEDTGVWDGARGNGEGAGAEDKVGVGCCARMIS